MKLPKRLGHLSEQSVLTAASVMWGGGGIVVGWGAGGVGGLLSDCLPLWLRLGAKSYGVLAVFR